MRKLAGIIVLMCGLGLFGVLLVVVGFHINPFDVPGVSAGTLQDVHRQVIDDATKQYAITQSSGSAMDRCVRAGIVAEAYLQANQETGYKEWKNTEQWDCLKAGVPAR